MRKNILTLLVASAILFTGCGKERLELFFKAMGFSYIELIQTNQ